MGAATITLAAGELFAPQISHWLYGSGEHTDLVRAAFVGLWATMNYDQLTALFRVEERSVSYSIASLANVVVTIGMTILLVVVLDQGPLGVLVGNFSGTLAVYAVLLAYRRTQLGLEFDRGVFWKMTEWGMPLVPSVIALNAIDFADRFLLVRFKGQHELGPVRDRDADLCGAPVRARRVPHRLARVRVLDPRGQRARGAPTASSLTYVTFFSSWAALALGLAAPWIVRLLTTPDFYGGARVVPMLSFAFVVFGAYVVVVTSIGRVGRRGSNWIITGIAAVIGVLLNLALIPPFGMTGAAVSMLLSYFLIFLGMTWKAQRVFHVHYQWRRLATAAGTAAGLTVIGKLVDGGLPAGDRAHGPLPARARARRLLPARGAGPDRRLQQAVAPRSRLIRRWTRESWLR